MRSGRVILLSDYVGGGGAATGGAGHAALDSYRALRDAGADVRVVAGFGAAPEVEADRFTSLGGTDLREGGARDALRAVYNPRARAALAAALAGEDSDTTLIVVHQWTRFLSPAALGVAARFPLMIYMHDYFWPCPNGIYYDFRAGRPCDRRPMGARCLAADCDRHGRTQKLGRVARQAMRRAATAGDPARRLFLHVSDHALRTAAPLLPGEHHAVIHNPLTIAAEPPPPPAASTYDVGYFGRLEPDKGVDALTAAVRDAGSTGLFVGQGSLEPLLAGVPGIDHLPWQPRDAVPAAMRNCAAVALPSRWHETWGLVVPEAMAAGVPVIVSERAGSAELVRRFGGGTVVDPEDVARLVATLRHAPAPPTARRADLRTFLSPERHAARLMALAESRFGLDLRARQYARSPAARRSPLRPSAPLPTM